MTEEIKDIRRNILYSIIDMEFNPINDDDYEKTIEIAGMQIETKIVGLMENEISLTLTEVSFGRKSNPMTNDKDINSFLKEVQQPLSNNNMMSMWILLTKYNLL